MARSALTALFVVVLLATAALAAAATGRARLGQRDEGSRSAPAATVAPATRSELAPVASLPRPSARESRRERPGASQRRFRVLRVRSGQSVKLRAKPGGSTVARVGARTEFASQAVLSVARRRGGWLGVVSAALPNGRLGWVREGDAAVRAATGRVSVSVDLSKRWLELRRGNRVLRRVSVAIGRPGSSTPTGRFAVTDKLPGSRYGSYYGCCILALNAKQPNLPPGWRGGNRLAIHGTNSPGSIGRPSSAGCLRAADDDLRILMRDVPLGTPVFIHG
jgi:hypothetical protein